jgi:predicted acetyltransferase
MTFRAATSDDCPQLAELNHELIQDEGHRNQMTVPELEQRMRGWLSSDYRAVIFEHAGHVVAYALFREQSDEIYVRQFFVIRGHRRHGLGRRAFDLLRSEFWPKHKRLTVEVLTDNHRAISFWHAVGFKDYALRLEILPQSLTNAAPSKSSFP